MKTTKTKPNDYVKMLKLVQANIGERTIDVIETYVKLHKVAIHRAGKVLWQLVDDGEITVATAESGRTYITRVGG